MDIINNYLNEVQNKAYEPVRDDIMRCSVCGRKADILNNGKGPLVCCGKPMIRIGEAVDRCQDGEHSHAATNWRFTK